MVDTAARTLFGAAPVYRSTFPNVDDTYAGTSSSPTLVVFKSPLSSPLATRALSSDDSAKSIAHWLRDWRLPIVSELTGESMRDLIADGSDARVVLASVPFAGREANLELLRDTAAAWTERRSETVPTRFLWVRSRPVHIPNAHDAAQADAAQLSTYLKRNYGVSNPSALAVFIVEPVAQRYYPSNVAGAPLDLSSDLYVALDAHTRKQLRGGRHSLSRFERAAETVGRSTERGLTWATRHPFLAMGGLMVFIITTFVLLLRCIDAPAGSGPTVKAD
jgi:hypothetical protein